MTDVRALMDSLEGAATGIDNAADRLDELSTQFEGWLEPGEDGEAVFVPGPKLRYEDAIQDEAARIYESAIESGDKPPPETVREAMALRKLKRTDEDLYHSYHRLKSEIGSLQKWISAKRETISARQSVLSAEKELTRTPAPVRNDGPVYGGQRA